MASITDLTKDTKYRQTSLFSMGVRRLSAGASGSASVRALPDPEPLKKAEPAQKRPPGRPKKVIEQPIDVEAEEEQMQEEDPAEQPAAPIWGVRVKLHIVKEKQSSVPWEEQQANKKIVRVHFMLVDIRPKRKRTVYTADQKALALRVLHKAGDSPALAVRRLLLNYGELFPDMNEITGEKNLRMWQKQEDKKAFATDQEMSLPGRKPILSESCLKAIYRVILEQVNTGAITNIKILTPIIKATIEIQGEGHCLKENGGSLKCGRTWVNGILKKLRLSYRKATTAAQKLPENWQQQGKVTALRLAFLVRRHKIPAALVVNFDQTGVHLVPTAGGRTYAPTGKKDICIAGQDDKRQMTGVPLSSADGEMGPFQLIIQGKTDRTLQPMKHLIDEERFAAWHFTYSANHWSSLDTMKEFVSDLLVPWLEKKMEDLGLPDDQKAVALMDCWSVHKSDAFRTWWKKEYPWLLFLFIPAGCTSKLQPADVALQRPFKAALTDSFNEYLSKEQVQPQLQSGTEASKIKLDLKLSTLKPHVPNFCYAGWKHCADQPELVKAGWEKCGLLKAWDADFQVEALDWHSRQELFPRTDEDLPSGSEGEGSPPGSASEAESDDELTGDVDAIGDLQNCAPPETDAILSQLAARIAARIHEQEAEGEASVRKRGRPKGSKNKPKENQAAGGNAAERSEPETAPAPAGRGQGASRAKRGRGRGRATTGNGRGRANQHEQPEINLFENDPESGPENSA